MLTATSATTLPWEIGNREGLSDYVVRPQWAVAAPVAGVTAVLRVKNEADNLPHVLPPLLQALRGVVIVDNGSEDGTADVARDLARSLGAEDRVDVYLYPFEVSRCGPDHLRTPADSVHSLTHYNNWAFSHVRTTYGLKWDGDVVPTERGVRALRDLEWQIEGGDRIVHVRHRPLYVADDRTAFVDTDLRLPEPSGWPNAPEYRYVKAYEWEIPLWPKGVPSLLLADWSALEIKRLDRDEFGHWSTDDFERSTRTARKRREIEVFTALARGEDPPLGVVRVEAPAGVHVIEYARSEWLRLNRPALDALTRELTPPA